MEKMLKNRNQPIKQLDRILGQTIEFISDGEKEIYNIRNTARQEYDNLEKELIYLKVETATLITAVDKLYQMYDLNRKKLLNSNSYSEDELRKLHKETELLRLKLEEEKDRESVIIRRRNDLEIQLRSTKDLSDRAEQLSSDFNIAVSLLNGSIKQITDTIEDINNKQALGIKILQVQEEERRRIAREMHDGLAQQLSQVLINAEFSVKLLDKDINLAKRELNSLKTELRGSISNIRRLIYNLRPMSLDDLGLIPTIKRDIELFQKANPTKNLTLNVSEELEDGKIEMSETLILTVYRIFQEAVSNIKKHSQAKNASIDMKVSGKNLFIQIEDDGVGMSAEKIVSTMDHGFGLSIMKERVDLLRGEIIINSEKGMGTKIDIKIPLSN
ncbi:sensor histidine kinase [Clostridiales bacterium COT073_COT-073]|nr:sensor histidine kinase [Clostridiales bacterium COT073_COT-073]